jgi:hypothetical protein
MSSSRLPIPQGALDMSLTRAGQKQLRAEKGSWARLAGAVRLIFDEGNAQ